MFGRCLYSLGWDLRIYEYKTNFPTFAPVSFRLFASCQRILNAQPLSKMVHIKQRQLKQLEVYVLRFASVSSSSLRPLWPAVVPEFVSENVLLCRITQLLQSNIRSKQRGGRKNSDKATCKRSL